MSFYDNWNLHVEVCFIGLFMLVLFVVYGITRIVKYFKDKNENNEE